MSTQNQLNTWAEFSADDWPDFDLSDYEEALRNGYPDDAAYVYAVEIAASRKSHAALPEHGYNNSLSGRQPMEFEFANMTSDHAQDSSVRNQIQPSPNDGAAHPAFLFNPSSTSYAYPEPPSPSAGFGLDSDWIMSDEDFAAGNPSTREADVSTLVATQTPPTPDLVYTSSSAPSSAHHHSTSPQNTQSVAAKGEVPRDNRWAATYAGRRGAKAREDFPRECGACHKRFLYEDSAVKHYRLHHDGPIDIILRYDAPKRPAPGRPRNTKAAKSQVRRGVNPTSGSEVRSQSPQTAPDDNLIQPSGLGADVGADAASGHARVSTRLSAPTHGDHSVPPNTTSVSAANTTDQPHANSLSLSNIDPALLAESSYQSLPHSQQHIPPTIEPLSQSYDATPHLRQLHPLTPSHHLATLDNQLTLPPLTTNNVLPATAQQALRAICWSNAVIAPHHIQAPIQNRHSSPRTPSQDPSSTATLSSQPIRPRTNTNIMTTTATTRTPPTASASTIPSTPTSTSTLHSTPQLQPQPDTTPTTTQPRVPSSPSPPTSNNDPQTRIFLHPHMQRWYKCVDGVWKHWDNDVSAWVDGP